MKVNNYNMKENKDQIQAHVYELAITKFFIILCVVTISMISITGYFTGKTLEEVLFIILFSFTAITITTIYTKLNKFYELKIETNFKVVVVSYIVSLILIMILPKYEIYNLWMIGPLVIAILIDTDLGILFVLKLTLLISFITELKLEHIVFYFILGTLSCILAKSITILHEMGYVILSIVSTNITLLILINNVISPNAPRINIFYSVISSLIFIGVSCLVYIFRNWYRKKQVRITILDENFELIIALKNHSEQLFTHCIQVAEVSKEAALYIGANPNTVKAGGMYHEIGRVVGNDYIREGIKIATKYDFPKEVTAIIRQHNSKFEKPKSIEAAIVMLTESIITTFEYLDKDSNKRTIQKDKIIEDIFRIRMVKGALDKSKLSIKDFNQLKKFFIEKYSY